MIYFLSGKYMITNGRHSTEKSSQPASDGRSPGSRGASAYHDGGQAARYRGAPAASPGFQEVPGFFRRGPRPRKSAPAAGGPAGYRPGVLVQPIISKATLIISLSLHLMLILFLAFGLPSCQEKSGPPPEEVFTVQLMSEPSPPPPPPAQPAPEPPQPEPQPEPQQPPAFELPLGDSSRNLQRSGRAEAGEEAAEDAPPPAPPEDLIALAPQAKAPHPELEKRRERKPEVKPPEVKRRTEPKPQPEADYSNVPQSLYRTLGRDAGAIHFGSRQGRRADPVVSNYFELALRKVNEFWTAPKSISPRLVVGIAMTIEPNGRISSVRITQPSGLAEYDRSVERAVKAASPLAPLPPVFGGQRVSQTFYFSPDALGRRR